MKLPISKLSQLTGIHRDTISKRLADLPFEAGKKGAKSYSSEDALAAIYNIIENLRDADKNRHRK